jgi:hypothetical protein
MSGVYKSLKGIMQDTLQRGKPNATPWARVKGSSALSLNDEMEELEKIFADRIGRLKAAVNQGESMVADEAQHAEQLVESLNVSIAVLDAKLKETEDAALSQESARQKMEETLHAKIHDLQNDVKKKDQALETRGNDVKTLKSNIDSQLKQVAELELAIEKAKTEAAGHAERAEHLTESSKTKIAALEAKLGNTEEIVRQKDATIKGLEQELTARIQDSESLMRNKDELLAGRVAEVNDLKSQLKRLAKGIGEMSSFFRQAEALVPIEGQEIGPAVPKNPLKGGEENLPKVTPDIPDAPREIVSPHLFQRITSELTEVTGVMGPIASIIVRDHVLGLGESMEKFPKTRLPELLESLSKEILDENLKIDFRERLAHNGQIGGEGDVLS